MKKEKEKQAEDGKKQTTCWSLEEDVSGLFNSPNSVHNI